MLDLPFLLPMNRSLFQQCIGRRCRRYAQKHFDGSSQVARELRSMVAARFPEAELFIAPIGPVIGAHAGPGVMTVFFWGNNR